MIEKLTRILSGMQEISAWSVSLVTTRSSELFYVGKKLETNRATDVETCDVTIYVDQDDKRGSSSFSVYAYMTEDDIREKILENVYAAGFALNPYYDLPKPANGVVPESSSNIRGMSLKDAAALVSDAIFKADVYNGGYLSATEIFVTETTHRIVNSNGVDLTDVSYGGNAELIPSWEKDGEEVEIYHMLRFESIDPEEITKKVDTELQIAAARFEARPLAKLLDLNAPIKVILQEDDAGRLFSYFANDLEYSAKYMKTNKFEPGDHVQGDNVTGTPLTLSKVPYVKGAARSAYFDADGVFLTETPLVENGVAVGRYGSHRYGRYLGVEAPAGMVPITCVKEGTKPFSEMAKEPYIRCAVFSGIQVEPNSGYFGGEVRLGYYFDGEKEIPVTGFSVSGDMNKSRGTMIYSLETVTTASYHGPRYLEIPDMKLA